MYKTFYSKPVPDDPFAPSYQLLSVLTINIQGILELSGYWIYVMVLWKKVASQRTEQRIRKQIDIDDMQFGFMIGKGTTDAIFIVRQMQEKFRAKGSKDRVETRNRRTDGRTEAIELPPPTLW